MTDQTITDEAPSAPAGPVYKTDPNESVFLTERDLATRWRWSVASLANQRSRGAGPRYLKIGASVRYRLSDVIAFERLNGRL